MRRTIPGGVVAAVVGALVAAPNDDYSLSGEITAPARGILLMSGGVDAANVFTTDDRDNPLDRYSHVIEGMDREAAETVAGLIR